MVKQKFSICIYLLSAILVIILSIFIYRIITHISYMQSNNQITISRHSNDKSVNYYSSKQLIFNPCYLNINTNN